MIRLLRSAMTAITESVTAAPAQVPRVPIPANGVDYRGKIVLAPMVRSGELPSRLLALHYGADLVWGPETIDRSLIGAERRVNPRNGTIEFTRMPSNGGRKEKAAKESVIYRIDPVREKGKLVFQMGTANPDLAVQAAKVVAGDVSGIDVNSGCPKPFSTSGGMGAALLRTPDKLVSILETLVREVGEPFKIGISVKIRILETPELTEALVTRLVRTGITGLTVHCRTTPMRPRERAIRHQLRMIRELCHNAGVACVMNGDVTSRDQALALMDEFGVDGAMIATAAESNSSCFRSEADGGLAPWRDVVYEYIKYSLDSENRLGNTKYLLNMLIPGKDKDFKEAKAARTYTDICRRLKFDDLVAHAIRIDEILEITEKWEDGPDENSTRSKAVQNAMESESARAAGGANTRSSKVAPATHNGGPIRTSSIPEPPKGKPAEEAVVGASIPVSEVGQKPEVMA
ncbi:tRNA-dihydrouridine(20) synthase [Penicillium macrosclerotiorum]|uniref:tRNA-dihydrouridine(20) synthase n=1 Tax=Penicillium macrosclerotiorum TaxID=303699 RepID=UPI002546A550|nr:tRNA-dihydrouridine(20) synthase [Penicillium macrosclerotiorum]KAJ5692571.1 tRNA-dihydrouridine(20) synthase [Penicillium macrosclerotiorum]